MTTKKNRLAIVPGLVLAALFLVADAAHAGLETVLAKGFNPNVAYQVNEFDSVNMLNGDLMLTVPFGPEYKTNGTLQYQFKLNYNGNFWAFFDYYGVDNPPGYAVELIGYGTYQGREIVKYYDLQIVDTDAAPSAGIAGSEAVPTGNAGAGWHFDMGSFGASPATEYFTQGGYHSPDGGSVSFGAYLHSDAVPPQDQLHKPDAYSRDGRYMRMRVVASSGTPRREVDFPDGTVKHFKCVRRCDGSAPEWNLEWIADPYGNLLKITRSPEARPAVGDWLWTFTETRVLNAETRGGRPHYQLGDATTTPIRTHTLKFHIDALPPGVTGELNPRYAAYPELRQHLVEARLAGPGGDASMLYRFEYGELDVMRTVVLPWVRQSDLLYPYDANRKIKIKVLKKVIQPAGGGEWKFNYHEGSPNDGANIYYGWNINGVVYPMSKIGGRIRSVETPLGGGYEYTYERRIFPRRVCVKSNPLQGNRGSGITVGVATRRQIGGGPGSEHPVWRYSGSAYPRLFTDFHSRPLSPGSCTSDASCPLDPTKGPDGYDDGDVNKNGQFDAGLDVPLCRAPLEYISAVLAPNGALTLNYYNAQLAQGTLQPNGVVGEAYGAPFSPVPTRYDRLFRQTPCQVSDPGCGVRRPLSTEIYAVSTAADSPFVTNLWDAVRRLSREYRAADGSEEPAPGTAGPRLQRSIYRTYDWSRVSCFDSSGNGTQDCAQLNLRVTGEHTRFNDDPRKITINGITQAAYVETLYSGFDGLGNFRQMNLYGNVRVVNQNNPSYDQWDHRATYTTYNPGVSFDIAACRAYPTVTQAGHPACNPAGMPAPDQSWFISHYDRRTSIEKNEAQTMLARYDPVRGRLLAMRTLSKDRLFDVSLPEDPEEPAAAFTTVQSPNDLVTVHERSDDSGNVSVLTQKHYGGDGASLRDWNATTYLPDGQPEYAVETRLQYGAAAGSAYVGCSGGPYLQSMSAAVQAASGLVTQVTDSTGLAHAYEYDGLGRVVKVTPPGGLTPQTYAYKVTTAGDPVNALTIARTGGSSMTYEYDHLGRLSSKSVAMPSGTRSVSAAQTVSTATTKYTYTSTNQVATVRQPTATATTDYQYDIFDRVTKVTTAAGDVTDNKYEGVRRLVTTIRNVALEGAGSDAGKTYQYDTFGRIIEADDEVAHANYSYDVLSNIARVTLKGSAASGVECAQPSTNCQVRLFGYDGRGFMTTAEHPELRVTASSDNVKIHYAYDARGHVTNADLEWASAGAGKPSLASWNLNYHYDAAERLTSVWTGSGATARPLKTFWYHPPAAPAGVRNQLRLAVRHNYIPQPNRTRNISTITVTKEHAYNDCRGSSTGRCGLVTSTVMNATASRPRECRAGTTGCVPGVESETFLNGVIPYSYDDRGELRTVGYPVVNGASAPGRTISYVHESGWLTGVKQGTESLASLQYYATGLPSRIQFKHPRVYDEIKTFANGLRRIQQIDWRWVNRPPSATTGQFAYDGAGNIRAMGTDEFQYDKALRLGRARIAGGAWEDFTYDVLGNLTQAGLESQHAFSVDFATNHVTAVMPRSAPHNAVTYDHAGNLSSMPDYRTLPTQTLPQNRRLAFTYDQFNRMTSMDGEALGRVFVYDPNDERVGIIDYERQDGTVETWSFRDEGARVLRDVRRTYNGTASVWAWQKDYVYRGTSLSNTIGPDGVRDVHLDHLGSVRYVTNAAGTLVSGSSSGVRYRPFGTLAANRALDERLAFTGHERDDDGDLATESDLDYMHARYYSPMMGRFLSVDPVLDVREAVREPQLWNRYSYVTNNPLKFTDADGRYRTFYYEKPMTSEHLAMDENTPAVIKGAFYAQGALLALTGAEAVGATAAGKAIIGATGSKLFEWGVRAAPLLNLLRNWGASQTDTPSLPFGISNKGLKHALGHLDEFRALDRSFDEKKLLDLAAKIASNADNLIGTPGGRKVYEEVVKIGEETVRVRIVINPAGNLRGISIKE